MSFDEIKDMLLGENKREKIELLSHLEDIFESYCENIEHYDDIINLLINCGLHDNDMETKASIYDTLSKAALYRDVSKFDFDLIENSLGGLPIDILTSVISILGYSKNKKYLPKLISYFNHEDAIVSREAKDAANEIEGIIKY